MSLALRLCAFVVIAIVGYIAWPSAAPPTDVTQLAVRQFQDDGATAEQLREAIAVQSWWPIVWPAIVIVIGIVMFFDDVEHWWKQESV